MHNQETLKACVKMLALWKVLCPRLVKEITGIVLHEYYSLICLMESSSAIWNIAIKKFRFYLFLFWSHSAACAIGMATEIVQYILEHCTVLWCQSKIKLQTQIANIVRILLILSLNPTFQFPVGITINKALSKPCPIYKRKWVNHKVTVKLEQPSNASH